MPVPDQAAQAKALALVLDIFKGDIAAAKEPEQKTKVAAELLQQGKECKGKEETAARYVLFGQARDLAAKAGDATLALTAVEEMARDFDVDALGLKAAALAQVVEATTTKEAGKNLVDLTLPLIAEALDADNYEVALALGKVAVEAAKKSKMLSLVTSVQKRNEEIVAVQKSFSRLQGFVDRLKKDPTDPEANLELGKYYGLLKGRWDRALPLLAKGNDPALRKLAGRDLEKPKDGPEQLALGDGWWEAASKEKDPAQLNLQRRAMFWYEQAVLNLTGLHRTKAQRRIDQVAARLTGSPVDFPPGPVGEIKKFEGHTEEVKSVSMSYDGRYAVSGSIDQTVRVWDLISGKEEKTLRGHTKQIWGVAFHPNSRQVFSASWDATARLWDFKTGQELKRFTHRLDLNGLNVSRDGLYLITGCDDHNLYLWNVSSGDEIRKFGGHTGFVYCGAFSQDGRLVVSGSVDKTVRVFEIGGKHVRTFEGHTNPVTAVALSPDSRYVFSAGDSVIHQWDIAGGKEVRKFEGHSGPVQGMALSQDGRRLVTGGDDKTIRLWDVATGKELHKYQGHTDSVLCVSVSHDGRRAVSGSLDRTVRLWGLPAR